jgi:hypothetical protein
MKRSTPAPARAELSCRRTNDERKRTIVDPTKMDQPVAHRERNNAACR